MSSQGNSNKPGMVINAPGARATPQNGQTTTRKLVMKPLKLKPQLPANFEADTWAKLQAAVQAVHQKQPVATSLEELYRAVEDMCRHQMQDRLYKKLQAECDAHIAQQLAALQTQTQLAPAAFLEQVAAMWDNYCSQMLLIRSIFLYLDRTYVISLPGLRSLFDTGLVSLRQHLTQHPKVESHIMRGLLDLIDRERQGEAVDRQLLAGLVRMLGDLALYSSTFSPRLLEETRAFYRGEGLRLMEASDVPHYLAHCESRLHQEQERCLHYLEPSSRRPLLQAVEQQLLAAHTPQILAKGFKPLMSANRVQDLARMYSLISRVGGTDSLRDEWRQYITTTGTAIVKDEANDKEMVERLLQLKAQLDGVLRGAFQASPGFADQLGSAFQSAVNSRSNKPAELVAKFIDAKLRGSKGVGEGELEAALDKALVLFGYIQGKDVFEAFYKRDLAKRLLLGRSASMDAEKLMISKLKAGCGGNFTANIEGMFRDMDVASETMELFRRHHSRTTRLQQQDAAAAAPAGDSSGPPSSSSSREPGGGVDVQVTVLTQAHWPTQTMLELNLPSGLVHWQTTFKDFYAKHYSTYRQLAWQHSMSTAMLRASFPKGAKELSVSLLQALVLLLFNDADELSYEAIKEQLGVKDDKELQRTLLSLSAGKVRVLLKSPKGPEVSPSDVFSYNAAFSNPLFRIKVNNIQMKETQEENAKTNAEVVQERQHAIDAAIVRVMKMRKTLAHKLLVQEVMTQLRFQLTNADLKRRIDNLIEREFLERSSSDSQVYNYLA
ncbi:Cullin-domain-containing protein [Scenedesmus sp. NREL 46B-D3]|nr:Cullin-domain-containing protein [Scenedesmus sp. NREL 46B-D3]